MSTLSGFMVFSRDMSRPRRLCATMLEAEGMCEAEALTSDGYAFVLDMCANSVYVCKHLPGTPPAWFIHVQKESNQNG